jgi:hypothetical protein
MKQQVTRGLYVCIVCTGSLVKADCAWNAFLFGLKYRTTEDGSQCQEVTTCRGAATCRLEQCYEWVRCLIRQYVAGPESTNTRRTASSKAADTAWVSLHTVYCTQDLATQEKCDIWQVRNDIRQEFRTAQKVNSTCWSCVYFLYLCSGSVLFESRLGHQLYWPMSLAVSPNPSS